MELLGDRAKGLYITPLGLRNLASYGYHGVDNSFFGNLILKHWWNWVTEQVPMWVAPNLLTLLGLVCNLLAYVSIAAYTPTLTETTPRWSCFVAAILIFLYQTLDNVDGKQARRTGSSSPLGELFDHGCDSITLGLLGIMTAGVTSIGGTVAFIGLVISWAPFYLAHWEEYHTGILVMGKFNGPTEAQLIVIALFIFTGIVGPWIWLVKIFAVGDTVIRLNHCMFAFTIGFAVITVGQNVHKVLTLPNRAMPTGETLIQLLPFSVLLVLSLIWLGTEHPLLEYHPQVALLAISLIFAYLVSRLIVNRVCKEPTQRFHVILLPLFVVAGVGVVGALRGNHRHAPALAWVMFAIALLQFLWFSVSLIRQLTTHLGIHAFKIMPRDPNSQQMINVQPTGVSSPLLSDGESRQNDDTVEISIEPEGETHSIE